MRLPFSAKSNKFVFGTVKCSGYIFYTFCRIANKVHFKKKITDNILFILSVSLGVYAFLNLNSQNFNGGIKSQILGTGINFSRKFFVLSTIYTKFFNFIAQVQSFEVIKAFYWIEEKVCVKY